jgi:hypothetical protein
MLVVDDLAVLVAVRFGSAVRTVALKRRRARLLDVGHDPGEQVLIRCVDRGLDAADDLVQVNALAVDHCHRPVVGDLGLDLLQAAVQVHGYFISGRAASTAVGEASPCGGDACPCSRGQPRSSAVHG